MARSSLNHAPRSMSRQRSLQNGRNGESADHSTGRSHVGHFTIGAAIDSGAAGEHEGNVVLGLHGSLTHIRPGEESQAAAMMAAADLRIER